MGKGASKSHLTTNFKVSVADLRHGEVSKSSFVELVANLICRESSNQGSTKIALQNGRGMTYIKSAQSINLLLILKEQNLSGLTSISLN